MFHVEHFSLLFLCAAVASSPLSAKDFLLPAGVTPYQIPLGGEIPPSAAALSSLGVEYLMIGENASAERAFQQSLRAGSTSPLTYIGLFLSTENKEQRDRALQGMNAHLEKAPMSPPEAFLVQALLALANQDYHAAISEFHQHAEQYRRDILSACWEIILTHYLERDQNEALIIARAQALYERFRDHALVCYTRALTEEFLDGQHISEEAIAAARCAAQARPDSPIIARLYGHLLYHRGDYLEAAKVFQALREQGDPCSYEALVAGIYEATALRSAGEHRASRRLRRAMAESVALGRAKAPLSDRAHALWYWEGCSLPLRVLITSHEPYDQSDIQAAEKCMVPDRDNPLPATFYRDCLSQLAGARYQMRRGRRGEAGVMLQRASQTLQQLESCRQRLSSTDEIYFRRACEACRIALNLVRAEVFTSTSELWKGEALRVRHPEARLLPPLIPPPGKIKNVPHGTK